MADLTKTPAFKRWFGKSAVTNAKGQPLVVYHGTTAPDFDTFRPYQRKNEQLGFGVHFAEDYAFAEQYATDPLTVRKGKNPRVMAVYLSVQRPFYADAFADEGTPEYELAKKLGGKRTYTPKKYDTPDSIRFTLPYKAIDRTSPERAERLIREAGYDGVRYTAQMAKPTARGMALTGQGTSWLVFEPTQIKLADGNTGAFDLQDPSIRRNPSKKCDVTGCRQAAQNTIRAYSFCPEHYAKMCHKLGMKPTPVEPQDKALLRRKARSTGTTVSLWHSADMHEDDPSVKFATLCEDHGGVTYHYLRKEAEQWLSHPEQWCTFCMEQSRDGGWDGND